MSLNGKKIVVALSGSIACYKSCSLVRELVREGAEVFVAMTKNSTKFVGPLTLESLSGHSVLVDLFDGSDTNHLDFAKGADAFLVAPATANIIGKFASGIADDAVSTLFLAMKCPAIIAPAMHKEMWENEIVKENVEKLKAAKVDFVGPGCGDLACGDEGVGRLIENSKIVERLECVLSKKDLLGKKVLITVGPTYESIDPVRYVSNWSSGKMGMELAKAFYMRGADVQVVSSLSKDVFCDGIKVCEVKSGQDMLKAVHKLIDDSDFYVSTAAIADFRPSNPSKIKLNKKDLNSIKFELNEDILASLANKKGKKGFIGFVLDSELDEDKILAKKTSKLLDLCIAVTVEAFGSDRINGRIYPSNENKGEFNLSKTELAHEICDILV